MSPVGKPWFKSQTSGESLGVTKGRGVGMGWGYLATANLLTIHSLPRSGRPSLWQSLRRCRLQPPSWVPSSSSPVSLGSSGQPSVPQQNGSVKTSSSRSATGCMGSWMWCALVSRGCLHGKWEAKWWWVRQIPQDPILSEVKAEKAAALKPVSSGRAGGLNLGGEWETRKRRKI